MSAINELKAVLLNPDGGVSIKGSDEDKKIIARTLNEIERQLKLLVYDAMRTRTGDKPLGMEMADCLDKVLHPDEDSPNES